MAQESILSDALLKQLMAVGQVDILVGLPTLNNAATVADVVRAVERCFSTDFGRMRTVMINFDAGSSDGTPELIRHVSITEGEVVQTSHALRTTHRVVTPYHGLPGKHTAMRTLFAAAALTQAGTLVVIDPAGPARTAERVTELIAPVAAKRAEFLAPRYRRHPRDGALITQLVRPLVRAVYGVGLDEPLGAEFACSGRFVSHCLDQAIWGEDAARFAIDLWLRTEAVANAFDVGQIWRPISIGGGSTTLRQAVRQILLSLVLTLQAHEPFWRQVTEMASLPTWGDDTNGIPVVEWDHEALGKQARHDLGEIQPLLAGVIGPSLVTRLLEAVSGPDPDLDDELWVLAVYAFLEAAHRGSAALDHLADMFVPLYMWRAAAFMARTDTEPDAAVQARLDALCATFQRLKPELVSGWSAAV